MHGPAGGRGKWAQSGVPHGGWICVGIDDLGADRQICAMCESQEIRHVHHMSHPAYPDELECGCDCAGHMEGDLQAARTRDRRMKSSAAKRARWPDRRGWYHSKKGNLCIVYQGLLITVYRKGGGWTVSVREQAADRVSYPRKDYPTERAAQLGAFDLITFVGGTTA